MNHITALQTEVEQAAADAMAAGKTGVIVPASTANLGPGYDAVGLALDLPLLATVEPKSRMRVISLGQGEGELPTGSTNMVWQGFAMWCAKVNELEPDISIQVHSAIPLEGGLGSSSAALVAGLALGELLVGGDADINELAIQYEGHPDNAVPAIQGGLILKPAQSSIRRFIPRGSIQPVALIIDERMATSEARRVLPQKVDRVEAAANGARVAAMVAGLAGFSSLEAADFDDIVHQPPRFKIMPTSAALVTALRAHNIPAFLSGAGPTVLALGDTDQFANPLQVITDIVTKTPVEKRVEILPLAINTRGVVNFKDGTTF